MRAGEESLGGGNASPEPSYDRSMTSPEDPAHAFDFWIGDWDVFGPQGKQVGTNTISALFGTGSLTEHWRGVGGIEGRSLNAYDAMRSCWHQTWVDATGTLLQLDGGWSDGAMVLEGIAPSDDDPGRNDLQRITWTPSGDGKQVRQLWEVSGDDGASWQVAFDGRYRRRTTS